MAKRNLTEEIDQFRRDKHKWVPLVIVLGIFGLALPVLPGLALLALGLLLLFPKQGEHLISKIRRSIKPDKV